MNHKRPFPAKKIPSTVDRRIQRKLMYADLKKTMGRVFHTYGVKAAVPLMVLIGVGYGIGFLDFEAGPTPVFTPDEKSQPTPENDVLFSEEIPEPKMKSQSPELTSTQSNTADTEPASVRFNTGGMQSSDSQDATDDTSAAEQGSTPATAPTAAPKSRNMAEQETAPLSASESASSTSAEPEMAEPASAMMRMAVPAQMDLEASDPAAAMMAMPMMDMQIKSEDADTLEALGERESMLKEHNRNTDEALQSQTCEAITEEVVIIADDGTQTVGTQTTYTCTAPDDELEQEEENQEPETNKEMKSAAQVEAREVE